MMHMVNANIGGKPAQDRGQVVMRTAVQGCIVQLPVIGIVPMCCLELVLHVEQPYPDRRGDQCRGQEHQKQRREPADIADHCQKNRNGKIGSHGADPIFAFALHPAMRHAVLQKEDIGWPKAEHH